MGLEKKKKSSKSTKAEKVGKERSAVSENDKNVTSPEKLSAKKSKKNKKDKKDKTDKKDKNLDSTAEGERSTKSHKDATPDKKRKSSTDDSAQHSKKSKSDDTPGGTTPREARRKQYWADKMHGPRDKATYASESTENEPKSEESPLSDSSVPLKKETAFNPEPRKKRQRGKKKRNMNPDEDTFTPRYLLFVGNMAYKTKIEDIYKHFGRFGGLIDVRLLTDKVTKKPKGTAFIEYDNKDSHGKAIGLHHTKLCGRVVNVELTVGGGGGGQNRKDKLKQKNFKHLGTGGPASINSMPVGTERKSTPSTPLTA